MEIYLTKRARVVTKMGAVGTFDLQIRSGRGWKDYAWHTRLGVVLQSFLTRALWQCPGAPEECTLGDVERVLEKAREELVHVANHTKDETMQVLAEAEVQTKHVTGDLFDDL